MVKPEPSASNWIPATEAARRLGIKRETLYAYVSRGMITRRRLAGGRESRFDAAEVARLAERKRSGGGRAGSLDIVIDSSLTLLDPAGKLWFRGWDAEEACNTASFEEIAEWLWAAPALDDERVGFTAPAEVVEAGRRAAAGLPAAATPFDRLRVAISAASVADPLRFDRRPEGVARSGRRIIATAVDALPPADAALHAGGVGLPTGAWPPSDVLPAGSVGLPTDALPQGLAPQPGGPVAARLWSRLSSEAGTPEQVVVLDAALVLLADHEIASSTLAARVAASTWADPYLVAGAGLAALGGPLHGGVGDRIVPLLQEALEHGPAQAVAGRWRLGETVLGFGHRVYTERDPRADALWRLLRQAWPDSPVLAAAGEVASAVTAHGETFPNVDFALAALVAAAGMAAGSAEAIFAVARIAGWLAHAMEEYQYRLRFRIRAAYIGTPPAEVSGRGRSR